MVSKEMLLARLSVSQYSTVQDLRRLRAIYVAFPLPFDEMKLASVEPGVIGSSEKIPRAILAAEWLAHHGRLSEGILRKDQRLKVVHFKGNEPALDRLRRLHERFSRHHR